MNAISDVRDFSAGGFDLRHDDFRPRPKVLRHDRRFHQGLFFCFIKEAARHINT